MFVDIFWTVCWHNLIFLTCKKAKQFFWHAISYALLMVSFASILCFAFTFIFFFFFWTLVCVHWCVVSSGKLILSVSGSLLPLEGASVFPKSCIVSNYVCSWSVTSRIGLGESGQTISTMRCMTDRWIGCYRCIVRFFHHNVSNW